MILNVIKEGEYTSNNTSIQNNNQNDIEVEKVQLKRIKELLNENDLKYVSQNIRNLLSLTKENDPNCFINSEGIKRRVIGAGERFRVILYIRLSREDLALENNDVSRSIKNQLLLLLDECSHKNWQVVGIFCEEDMSGVDDKRPEWLKSIRYAELGKTEIVLCKSQSRFTRSMEMVEKYLHKCFPEWNVRFVSIVDHADTSVQENKKSRQINGLMNEWYVEDTSISTRAILNSMKRNGQFVGNVAPYGYLIDPNDKHHLLPDNYAREAVKIMAGMLKHGKGMNQVIEVLMRKKFLTPADYRCSLGIKIYRGKNVIKMICYKVEKEETLKKIANKFYISTEEIKSINNLVTNEIKEGEILKIPYKQKWTASMIRKIVTDETQIGSLVQGKTERISFKNHKKKPKEKSEWIVVPHCHEANLDLETFETVSAMFKPHTLNRSQRNGDIPLFSKKVYCSCCGKSFYKNSKHISNGNFEYLQCRGNKTDKICDNSELISMEDLKTYILGKIKEKIQSYYDLNLVKKDYYLENVYLNIDNDISNLEKEQNKIQTEIEKKQNILIQLYNDKATGIITQNEFNIINSGNAIEIERLKEKRNEVENKIANLRIEKDKEKDKENLFLKYKDIDSLNRVILDSFISKIEIGKINQETKKRIIEIEWNLYSS